MNNILNTNGITTEIYTVINLTDLEKTKIYYENRIREQQLRFFEKQDVYYPNELIIYPDSEANN